MSDTQAAQAPAERPQGWLIEAVRPYTKPAMAAMLLLGFASGLPLYLVYQKTSYWLRIEGIERSTIGFFYLVGLFYSFKFLWAPIIDKLKVPLLGAKLGHRRSWMIVAIAGTVAGLSVIATGDPSETLVPITLGAILLAFSGATLDISIDAWRIESAPTDQQANMAASYSLGYRGALIFSGLGLIIGDQANWNVSFLFMAASMAVTGALVLLVKEPDVPRGKRSLARKPWLAGPAQASAVAVGLFCLAALLLSFIGGETRWGGFDPKLIVHALVLVALACLVLGERVLRGTKMALRDRLVIGAVGAGCVYAVLPILGVLGDTAKAVGPLFLLLMLAFVLAPLIITVVHLSGNVRKLSDQEAEAEPRGRLFELFGEPFRQVLNRFGPPLFAILALVMLYRLSDFTMGVMATSLYADLGYDGTTVGTLQSGPGVLATFIGLFLGGLAAHSFGLIRSMMIGALLTLLTNGAYAWFASVATGNDPQVLALAICADNVAGGFVTTVFIAYLSSLVDPANAATQYALFSSIYATINKFAASYSGVMADTLGWVNFFLLTASYAIPAALLVVLVAFLTKRYPPKAIPAVQGAPA
ncbi:AmpG family muropeptide MFS transporter [Parvularcula maris]|uniref:MFS transporter n=1 Tax=Parvularcula maris TaxID=2965077 RepID=A0A9X2L6P0_9PROT|nr:MFS transporter [Parvularcula maris]MCQ8184073.1 MFS transporter [Parvularcula maris]